MNLSALSHKLLVIALLALITLAFIPIAGLPYHRAVSETMDAGHFPAFMIITLCAYILLKRAAVPRPLLIATLSSICLALAIELIQPFFSRTQSSRDFFVGNLGILAAAIGIHFRRYPQWWLKPMLVTATLVIFAGIATPAYREWLAVAWQHRQFPVLGDFENTQDLRLWDPTDPDSHSPTRISRSVDHASHGKHSLMIEAGLSSWPGIVNNTGDMNWAAFKNLRFDIYNPTEPFILHLRVDDNQDIDDYDERFNNQVTVETGRNEIAIPLSAVEVQRPMRRLHLNAVRRIVLYLDAQPAPRTFYIDHIRLE
ncbi:MAG: hypothetical protein AB1810_02380 [Pseudomonadota bacterium]